MHSDCGAYGENGTEEGLKEDLKKAKVKIEQAFPDLTVHTVVIHLNQNGDDWDTSVEKL